MKKLEVEYKPRTGPNFCAPVDLGTRPWGTETLLCHVKEKYMMKRLFVKKGSKGGLQYHRFKDEAGILLSGKMIIRFENEEGKIVEKIVSSGDVFHFPPGVVHQEEALEDCIVIECGTPILNDRVRMEEHFGLGEPVGMPTTSADEVEFG